MANKKMLPRELKMKQRIEELENKLTYANDSLRMSQYSLESANQQIKQDHILLRQAHETIKDLEDFKKITRLALPFLNNHQMMAANNSNSES